MLCDRLKAYLCCGYLVLLSRRRWVRLHTNIYVLGQLQVWVQPKACDWFGLGLIGGHCYLRKCGVLSVFISVLYGSIYDFQCEHKVSMQEMVWRYHRLHVKVFMLCLPSYVCMYAIVFTKLLLMILVFTHSYRLKWK